DQQDPQKPTKANIIDWQLAERGSPVLDLAYFLFTCGSTEVIINYPTHLKTYHDALTESLTKLSCNVGDLYPFELLVVQWHKYSKFGLFMALIMIKFMLSEKDEVPDISQMAKSGMSFVDRLNFVSIHDDAYNKRISEIITVLARSSLI
ncbi:uncharacterized protein LOC111692653, partial [Anoplophora glabripennis]|uniref:uncharacterized protein LOC111692653 n=1 Tax=Anoplophora glabripennis TaxID=217634 RepID=UPI000C7941D5